MEFDNAFQSICVKLTKMVQYDKVHLDDGIDLLIEG